MSSPAGPERADRRNGLVAASYVWLRQVDIRQCRSLLVAMAEAQIACYTAIPQLDAERIRDVYVDERKRSDAGAVADAVHLPESGRRLSMDTQEIDDRFAELISSIDGPSGVAEPAEPADGATSSRSRVTGEQDQAWRHSDVDWLAASEQEDDEGYEPPPPDPLPRPTSKVVGGILLLITGCIALFSPGVLPIPPTASIVLGVAFIGGGVGYLLMQLRDHPQDPFDDGARV